MEEKQFTVLVVDDDACFRQLIVHILTPEYRVVQARTVVDAVALLAQKPDLAIIDFHLPGMDGDSFIRNLRDQGHTLPLVFCSGASIDHKTFSSMRNVCQVNLIVQKPIQPLMFKEQIAALLPKMAADIEADNVAYNEYCENYSSYKPNRSGENSSRSASENLSNDESANSLSCSDDDVLAETERAIQELAHVYLSEVPENLDQLRLEMIMAAAQKEIALLDLAANRAHQLKGTAGSLGFTQLGEYGRMLEKALHALMSEELFEESENWQSAINLIDRAMAWTDRELAKLNGRELEPDVEPEVESELEPEVEPEVVPEQSGQEREIWPDVEQLQVDTDAHFNSSDIADIGKLSDSGSERRGSHLSSSSNLETLGEFKGLTSLNFGPENFTQVLRVLPQRVLVIDANQASRSAIADTLSGKYNVQTVSGAMESFAVMDEFQPDAVIIQLTMPGVNGLAVSRMIRCNELWQNTVVIILTDNCAATTRHNIFAAGATDYVVLPVVPQELTMRVDMHLVQRESRESRTIQLAKAKLLLDSNSVQ
jgi:DNA-binding response OmpR family regulator